MVRFSHGRIGVQRFIGGWRKAKKGPGDYPGPLGSLSLPGCTTAGGGPYGIRRFGPATRRAGAWRGARVAGSRRTRERIRSHARPDLSIRRLVSPAHDPCADCSAVACLRRRSPSPPVDRSAHLALRAGDGVARRAQPTSPAGRLFVCPCRERARSIVVRGSGAAQSVCRGGYRRRFGFRSGGDASIATCGRGGWSALPVGATALGAGRALGCEHEMGGALLSITYDVKALDRRTAALQGSAARRAGLVAAPVDSGA